MIKPISIDRAKKLLLDKPNRFFYLHPIYVPLILPVGSGEMLAGYHIFTSKIKSDKLIKVKGLRIWDYIDPYTY